MTSVVVTGRRLFMKYSDLDYIVDKAGEVDAEVVAVEDEAEEPLLEASRTAVAIVTIGRKISAEMIRSAANLRLIQMLSVGYDCVDVAAATAKKVVVCNNPIYCTDEVANHTLTLLMAVARKLHIIMPRTNKGEWDYNFARPIPNFAGRTLGIIGLGKIGRRVADKARSFGFRLAGYDPYIADDIFALCGVERYYDLPDLLAASEYLTIHAPLNGETHHLISAEALQSTRDGAVIVNTARGGLIDETAVSKALDSGKLAGAGIDVLEVEPPAPDHPLLKNPKALITPHIAWYSEESLRQGLTDGIEEMVRVLKGRRPRYVVNPQVFFDE